MKYNVRVTARGKGSSEWRTRAGTQAPHPGGIVHTPDLLLTENVPSTATTS